MPMSSARWVCAGTRVPKRMHSMASKVEKHAFIRAPKRRNRPKYSAKRSQDAAGRSRGTALPLRHRICWSGLQIADCRSAQVADLGADVLEIGPAQPALF